MFIFIILTYRKTSIKRWVPNKRRVSNKRPGLLEIQYQPYTTRVASNIGVILVQYWTYWRKLANESDIAPI